MAIDFNMKIIDDFDHIIDEKGNTFMALRKIRWSDKSNVKLDLRKYMIDSEGNEVIGKGCGFLTEEGPHELVKVMVENGYGNTYDILNGIKDRDDFMKNLAKVLPNAKKSEDDEDIKLEDIEIDNDDEEEYFDPRELVQAE